MILGCVANLNVMFGSCGFNPALATAYIIFEETQFLHDPNLRSFANRLGIHDTDDVKRSYIDHYLWAYLLAPMVGGFVGGILYLIHQKCQKNNGSSSESGDVDEEDKG